MRKSLAVAAGVLGGTAALVAAGRYRFNSLVRADIRHLLSSAIVDVGRSQLSTRLQSLPAPIKRYMRYAVTDDAPAIRNAHLLHSGLFRTSPAQRWYPIQAEEYFGVATPGFVWHARVRPAPLVWLEVRDAFISNRANVLVKLASLVPVADGRGSEIDQGSALRWLAECAWLPYAFIGEAVQWQPIDDEQAIAALRYEGPPVSATVRVDQEGKLTELKAERYRDIGGGRSVLSPWGGWYREYRQFHGFRVPTSVEVAWEPESDKFSYAQFSVSSIDYNVSS